MANEYSQDMDIIKGIGASPGISIGPACLMDASRIKIPRKNISPAEVEQEKTRFAEAVSLVERELQELVADLPEEIKEHSSILTSHILMLRDRMVYDRTMELIGSRRINAEWALCEAFKGIKTIFARIKDTYIRERLEDIQFVVERVKSVLLGTKAAADLFDKAAPAIIVTRDLSPADTLQMGREKAIGFVTELGSRTSHTAILARSLGIPAVVGADDVISRCIDGENIIVDGLKGLVILRPSKAVLEEYREKSRRYAHYRLEVIQNSSLPAETVDGYRIKVKANMELMDEIPMVIQHGAEGVGLFRTEFLYLARRELPAEEELFNVYRQVAESLAPYPVTIRTLDIGGDKFVSNLSIDDEINPALGLRAIRLCLKERGLFKVQLRAILRASAFGHIRLLFPMVSGQTEIVQVRQVLAQVKAELDAEDIKYDKDLKIGIMIEVPSAVLIADVLAREVDFFSIGTNDLIQYSLAIDRVNDAVSHLYEPLHPGVLRMIRMIVEAGHRAGIEVGMCGEMAGEPLYVPILLGIGLDELSMNAMAIPKNKRLIRQSSQEDCAAFASELLGLDSARAIKKRAVEFFHQNYPADMETRDFLEFGISV